MKHCDDGSELVYAQAKGSAPFAPNVLVPKLKPLRLLAAAFLLLACAAGAKAAPLASEVREGMNLNVLSRTGSVSAHLVLRDGTSPRILAAFPAGDSGVGCWFASTAAPVHWRLVSPQRPIAFKDGKGRLLHGITEAIEVEAPELTLSRVVLGSVRMLRDYEALHTAPANLDAPLQRVGDTLTWSRDRLDGAPGYLLSLQDLDQAPEGGDRPVWRAHDGRVIRFRLTAATGETPLTALGADEILTPQAGSDARARQSLAFLSYHEKLLAGSWRFDTYFGRDTLMSVRLLLPVLQPEEAEAGLGAVLSRLSSLGEVAHEESIGEFAVVENLKAGRGAVDTPVYDYKMIDADYMLAPVLQAYAQRFGAARLAAFLRRAGPTGQSYGALLVRNLRHVVDTTRPFAEAPAVERLLHLKPGVSVGQWRDSETGLAGGRIPYDVNAVFAPAALAAIDALLKQGALAPYVSADDRLQDASDIAERWRQGAPAFFRVGIPAAAAREEVVRFARESGVDPAPALASLPTGPLRFFTLSLDQAGRPIPVLHSDVGFDLLFGTPAEDTLAQNVDNILRPFPAGLMTNVGVVVANAAYADAPVRRDFSPAAYHGAVVWAWQEAVLIAGLDRQLARADLSPALKAQLAVARDRIWTAVQAVGETRTSELWSWAYADHRYRVQAFGANAKDADESNAAQLWSTVFLALEPRAAH